MIELIIKEKIIKALLESPKTTGKLAIELGYVDEKGYGKYNFIKSDLKTLEQYGLIHRIESNKKSLGKPATTYDIVYKISVLREILEKYPSLIPDLQKSDKIIDIVWDYFMQKCNEMFPSEEASILDDDINVVKTGSEIAILMELLPSPELRKMFQLSPSYFMNFLINDSFLKSFHSVWMALDGDVEEVEKEDNIVTIHMFYDVDLLFLEAFSHSVITDFIYGYGKTEALDLIRKLRASKLNKVSGNPEALKKLNECCGE